jgi:hypothetical protein
MIKTLPKLQLLTRFIFIFPGTCLVFLNLIASAQMPDHYISKVQFQEKTEVVYELVDDSSYKCLTLDELSRFHGHHTVIDKTQLIDVDGQVHTLDVYMEEKQVRDAWMDNIGRIYSGPEFAEFYSIQEQLLYRSEVVPDTSIRPITEHEALTFWEYDLGDSTLIRLLDRFQKQGVQCIYQDAILKANTDQSTFLYDRNTQISVTTEYDLKTNQKYIEHLVHYQLNDEGTYYPDSEITIEWIRTKNDCCVRKTTTITRSGYVVTINPDFQGLLRQPEKPENRSINLYDDIDVSLEQISHSEEFVIRHPKGKTKPVRVTVYDLTGRIILNRSTNTGEVIELPKTTQTGMYLVHIFYKDQTKPSVAKILISSSKNQL